MFEEASVDTIEAPSDARASSFSDTKPTNPASIAEITASVATAIATDVSPTKNAETLRRYNRYRIQTDLSRDALLTTNAKKTLDARYMLAGETYQDTFARPAITGSNDKAHAERLYKYISLGWFTPATPGLTNLGAPSGLPISCFLNEVQDSMKGIVSTWTENVWLGVNGGGTGSYWGNVRSLNEAVGLTPEQVVLLEDLKEEYCTQHGIDEVPEEALKKIEESIVKHRTSGIVPFLKVSDSLAMAISQGGLRRAMNAAYLPVWHPEIEDFIDIRRPTGGDPNRKAINLHHGVCIPDEFMVAVQKDADWNLISPKDNTVVRTIKARMLFIKILTARMEQGEPYILYVGSINTQMPWYQKNFGLTVKTSNLCAEITLPTGLDHLNRERTAVCCLASVNLTKAPEYWNDDQFWMDIYYFLDNVLDIFIADAPEEMANAVYFAQRERSIGLGFMGWHDFLQEREIPYESVEAMAWARRIDNHMRAKADMASYEIAKVRGPCLDALDAGVMERFACKQAIAPTASISIITGCSPGNETLTANAFVRKTIAGTMQDRNPSLERLLQRKGMNTDAVWSAITTDKGSVLKLDFLSDKEKSVFKTATEIDHVATVRLAALRTGVCQSQATNVFLPADIHKKDLTRVHVLAWLWGVKSLYYCRSVSIQRADAPSQKIEKVDIFDEKGDSAITGDLRHDENVEPSVSLEEAPKFEVCLACQ